MADLGIAFVEHQHAYRVYSDTLQHRARCEQLADYARQQHDVLMAGLAKSMDLPPGDWNYDRPTGTLKKEPTNG